MHVLIGIAVYSFQALSKLYLIAICLYFSYRIFKSNRSQKVLQVLLACGYVVGVEVFLRMTGGSFLYETSKYLVIVFCLMGIFTIKLKQPIPYIIYVFLLVPGILVAGFNMTEATTIRTAIAFNLSGPVCLGVVAIFCYKQKLTYQNMHKVLFTMALPLVVATTYLFLYTPSIRDTITGTGSNFAASGGFGPNQVVITFSRGGVLTALIMIAAFVFFYFRKVNVKAKFRISRTVFIFASAASHNEMSRILSEHGLFGMVAFLILLITPLIFRIRNKSNVFFYSFYLFWFLTINHSSMRIAAPLMRLLDMIWTCFKYRKQADYVLIDTYSTRNFYYAYFVSIVCQVLKLKYLPILHGGKLPERLKRSPKLSKRIFNNAYLNIAPSSFTKSKFEAAGFRNIKCIPNTIELNKYEFKQRIFEDVKLLWVRSFSKIYNPLLAVKILKALYS